MSVREEKRAAFNEQMNAWVSRQGLLFQLRHAAGGQSIVSKFVRVFFRLAVLLLIVGVCLWIFLLKRVDSEGFKDNMREAIEASLQGENCKVGTFRKERGMASLAFVKLDGTEKSFFHQLDARGVNTNMKLTDGLLGSWNGQSLSIEELDLYIKAGEKDDKTAAAAYQSLFIPQDSFKFERLESKITNVKWGYSEHNSGYITGSHMLAGRVDGGWRLEFRGGTFAQSWLKGVTIKKMVVFCNSEGVNIQEAVLTSTENRGSITFLARVGSGAQPGLQGSLEIQSFPITDLLDQSYNDWMQGNISGKGGISGSTNSQEGVVLDLDLKVQNGDVITVRDRVPILSALTVVDVYNTYRKVSFDEGGFHARTGNKVLNISKVNLKAGDLLHLRGDVKVRPPSNKEIAEALDLESAQKVSDILYDQWKFGSDDLVGETDDSLGDENDPEKQKLSVEDSIKKILLSSIKSELEIKRFEGELQLGLKPDAFDTARRLKQAYPVDVATQRIWIKTPLEGRLQRITLDQAKSLYELGRERRE